MKAYSLICAIVLVVLLSNVESNAEELPQRSTFEESVFEPAVVVRGDRHRRVTCDLLSFDTPWGSFNHAVCAAHCLAMGKGYRGGHCDSNGICICRK